MVKNAIEAWSNGINDFADNTGVNSSSLYMADLSVYQMDRDDPGDGRESRQHIDVRTHSINTTPGLPVAIPAR